MYVPPRNRVPGLGGMYPQIDPPARQQLSSSLIDTRDSLATQNFLRKSVVREEGWLEVKCSNESYNLRTWKRCFVVFDNENSNGGIDILESPSGPSIVKVSMTYVLSFKTYNNNSFKLITTGDQTISLRADNPDEVKNWIFTFQKSVALVLSKILKDHEAPWSFNSPSDRKLKSIISSHPSTVFSPHPQTSDSALSPQTARESSRPRSQISLGNSNQSSLFRSNPIHIQTSPSSISSRYANIDNDSQNRWNVNRSSAIPMSSSYHFSSNGYLSSPIGIPASKPFESTYEIASSSPLIPINNFDSEQKATSTLAVKLSGSFVDKEASKSSLTLALNQVNIDPIKKQRDSFTSASSVHSQNSRRSPLFEFDSDFEVAPEAIKVTSKQRSSLTEALNPQIQSDSSKFTLNWESGSCTILGQKETNEDRFVREDNVSIPLASQSDNRYGYFAVYDGHAGSDASIYLKDNLLDLIVAHPQFEDDIVQAMTDTCHSIDQKFNEVCKITGKNAGTTALGIFLRCSSSELIIFNIGDSSAVLCTDGHAEELMQTHKPNLPSETERILNANGWVTEEKELYLARLHMMNVDDPWIRSKAEKLEWVEISRICGEISVSRSIGDYVYKNFVPGEVVTEYFAWPDGHNKIFNADLVIPTPDCRVVKISRRQEFVVLASDGLWDVVSPQEAVDSIKEKFAQGKDCNDIAEEMCKLALQLGSSDNITVVIVKFIE